MVAGPAAAFNDDTAADALPAFWKRRWEELRQAPPPSASFRDKLSKDFAVLLMRTSYSVADELDFVAMDEFQKQFYFVRRAYYEDYLMALDKVAGGRRPQQGELTDPQYFDFISFAQYATIAQEIKTGKTSFVEKQQALVTGSSECQRTPPLERPSADACADADFGFSDVAVTRDAALPADNSKLLPLHAERVGDTIYRWLIERYPGENGRFSVRARPEPTCESLAVDINQLFSLMCINGYAIAPTVKVATTAARGKAGRGTIEASLDLPATLWSQQALRNRGTALANDFEAKVVMAHLRACGVDASYQTTFDDTDVKHTFELRSGLGGSNPV